MRMPLEHSPVKPGRWKRPVLAAVMVMVVAGLGSGAAVLHRAPAGPLPPPEVPWPVTGNASVFLCADGSTQDPCGERAITAAQRRTVEGTLRALPEVTGVRFESQAEAYKNFLEVLSPGNALGTVTRESDMPESFLVDLATTTGDFQTTVEQLPGVVAIHLHGTSFWTGKTDVVIRLCPADNTEPPCAGRGPATTAEKAAIYEALRTVDGVAAIYLEEREHATRDHFWRISTQSHYEVGADIPEAFHLNIDAPDAADRVKRAVGHLPGVDFVSKEWG